MIDNPHSEKADEKLGRVENRKNDERKLLFSHRCRVPAVQLVNKKSER